jgi:hypothetical protein
LIPIAGLTWRLPRHNTPLPIMSIYRSFCQHGLGASSKNVVLDYSTTDKKAIEMLVYLQQNCSDEVFAGYNLFSQVQRKKAADKRKQGKNVRIWPKGKSKGWGCRNLLRQRY